MSENSSGPTVPEEYGDDLKRVIEQLKAEEVSASDARLSSTESLQLWIATHPALQQSPAMTDLLSSYGPAVLEIVRRLLSV